MDSPSTGTGGEEPNIHQQSDNQVAQLSSQKGNNVQLESSDMSKQFTCKVCGKAYHRKNTLNRHMRESHTELPPEQLQCKFCDKSTKCIRMRINHEKQCSKNPKCIRFTCKICKSKYASEQKLKLHCEKMHE